MSPTPPRAPIPPRPHALNPERARQIALVAGRDARWSRSEVIYQASRLRGERVLITGAGGSIGSALMTYLAEAGVAYVAMSEQGMDVTDAEAVAERFAEVQPTVVFHLAGAKHAPLGEDDPLEPARVHIDGTANVLRAAAPLGARVVTASTCKACDPETAYGATKLVAERLTLNAGGSVARFFNVVDTQGNVFETWAGTPGDLHVADCERYFQSTLEAVYLLVYVALAEPGRFAVNPGHVRHMVDVARALHPTRAITFMRRRRGDRRTEPLHAASEQCEELGWLYRLSSPHDPDAS